LPPDVELLQQDEPLQFLHSTQLPACTLGAAETECKRAATAPRPRIATDFHRRMTDIVSPFGLLLTTGLRIGRGSRRITNRKVCDLQNWSLRRSQESLRSKNRRIRRSTRNPAFYRNSLPWGRLHRPNTHHPSFRTPHNCPLVLSESKTSTETSRRPPPARQLVKLSK